MGAIFALTPDGADICRTFTHPDFAVCIPCSQQPDHLDIFAPVTYSEHGGQLHRALRTYKDGAAASVVIGRHLQRSWKPNPASDTTCGDLFDELPKRFDWGACAVH